MIPAGNSLMCAIIVLISTFGYVTAIYFTSFYISAFFKSCVLLSLVFGGLCIAKITNKEGLKLSKKKIISAGLIIGGLVVFKLYDA